MLERTESSVLVSLRELGRLEDDRVAREEAAQQRRVAEAERAKREAADAAWREAEARTAEEAAQARGVIERERAETAKLVAAREAAVARATILAASEAELAASRERQTHELRLAEIASAGRARQWKFVQMGFASTLVVMAVGAGWLIHHDRVRAEAERLARENLREAQIESVSAMQAALDRRQGEIERAAAEQRAGIERLRREGSAAAPVASTVVAPGPRNGGDTGINGNGKTVPKKERTFGGHVGCAPMDPLCGDLVR